MRCSRLSDMSGSFLTHLESSLEFPVSHLSIRSFKFDDSSTFAIKNVRRTPFLAHRSFKSDDSFAFSIKNVPRTPFLAHRSFKSDDSFALAIKNVPRTPILNQKCTQNTIFGPEMELKHKAFDEKETLNPGCTPSDV